MSLISSFVINHVISLIEQEFTTYQPQLQATLANEVTALAAQLGSWAEAKLIALESKSKEENS